MGEFTTASKAIGIDIGSHSVKVAALQHRLGSVSIEKAVEVPVQRDEKGVVSPEAVQDALRGAMEGIRVRKDIVVVGVSAQAAAVRTLSIPFSDISKARAVIKFQAEPHLPFPIEDVIIDFFDMGTGTEDRMDVLLTAIRKQALKDQIDIVREAGIDPEVLETDFVAVCNTVNKSSHVSDEGMLVMDIGSSKTIVSFVKGGMPLAFRSFPIGGDAITNAIARELNVSFDEAERLKVEQGSAVASSDDSGGGQIETAMKPVLDRFAGEISRTLRFFGAQFSGGGHYSAVITGGGAQLKRMDEFLHEILGREVSVLESIDSIRSNTGEETSMADFATATGLGLRGLGESPFLQNFRQEDLAYSQSYKRIRMSIYTSAALLIAIFLAYLAGLVVKQQTLQQRSLQLSREIRTEVHVALGETPGIRDPDMLLDRLRSSVDSKRRELQDLRGTKSRSVLDVLKELSELIPEEMEVELETFSIADTKTGAVLIIAGTAKTNEDIVKIEENLKASASFGEVRTETVSYVAGRERYRFKFKIDFRES